MELKSARWGYDGGGIACGPVEGSIMTELMILDDDGHTHFVTASQFNEFGKIMITDFPILDVLVHLTDHDVDFDYEWGKVQDIINDSYDYELNSYDSEGFPFRDIYTSKYSKAIYLAIDGCFKYDFVENCVPVYDEYVDTDIDKIDISNIKLRDAEDLYDEDILEFFGDDEEIELDYELSLNDGRSVTLTIDDFRKAYSLGCGSIEDIVLAIDDLKYL